MLSLSLYLFLEYLVPCGVTLMIDYTKHIQHITHLWFSQPHDQLAIALSMTNFEQYQVAENLGLEACYYLKTLSFNDLRIVHQVSTRLAQAIVHFKQPSFEKAIALFVEEIEIMIPDLTVNYTIKPEVKTVILKAIQTVLEQSDNNAWTDYKMKHPQWQQLKK
jgi:hypothetical protein